VGYAIAVDEERRRVTVTISEVVNLTVLTTYVDELVQRGYWSWSQIIDTSSAIAFDLHDEEMIAFAETLADRAGRGQVVIVAVTRGARGVAESLLAVSRSIYPDRIERRRIAQSLQEAHDRLDAKLEPASIEGSAKSQG
jgi:hypothetical protein